MYALTRSWSTAARNKKTNTYFFGVWYTWVVLKKKICLFDCRFRLWPYCFGQVGWSLSRANPPVLASCLLLSQGSIENTKLTAVKGETSLSKHFYPDFSSFVTSFSGAKEVQMLGMGELLTPHKKELRMTSTSYIYSVLMYRKIAISRRKFSSPRFLILSASRRR